MKIFDNDGNFRGCACKAGYYDASQLQIHCWSHDRKSLPEDDALNAASINDMSHKDEYDGKGFWKSACVMPADCSAGGNLSSLTISAGYGLFVTML